MQYSRMLCGVINISKKADMIKVQSPGSGSTLIRIVKLISGMISGVMSLSTISMRSKLRLERPDQRPLLIGKVYENNTSSLPVLLGRINKYSYYLGNNLKCPSQVRSEKIEGIVNVSATITVNGEIVDEKVEGEAAYGLGEEALRIVKLLPDEWLPISIEGKPVAIRLFLPIHFILS